MTRDDTLPVTTIYGLLLKDNDPNVYALIAVEHGSPQHSDAVVCQTQINESNKQQN